jgi:hypothetical protein
VAQPVVRPDDAVVHVGGVLRVVEEQELAGGLVNLRVGGDAVDRRPALQALLFQRVGIQPIALAALVEGGEDLAGMDHHVRRR